MKKPTNDLNELYTSQETRTLLNVSSSTLANLVEKGLIEKITFPGKKHGFYTRTSVDEYRRQQIAFKETYVLTSEKVLARKTTQHQGIVFREATLEDIEQEAR